MDELRICGEELPRYVVASQLNIMILIIVIDPDVGVFTGRIRLFFRERGRENKRRMYSTFRSECEQLRERNEEAIPF